MTKKKQVEEVKLEVDIDIFFDNLRKQIKLCQKSIEQIEKQIAQFVELANMINNDKGTYNLKYYFTKNGMVYERSQKKEIGF